MSNYGYTKKVDYDFQTATEKTREELGKEGFGILTEIDVKATLKKKLDKDVEDYVILGACNPPFAARGLEIEQELGLLLPCNVIVYKKEEEIFVSALKPTIAMSFIGNEQMREIANTIEGKLKTAIDKV